PFGCAHLIELSFETTRAPAGLNRRATLCRLTCPRRACRPIGTPRREEGHLMDGTIARRITTSLTRTARRLRRAIDTPTRTAAAAAMATALLAAALPANSIRMAF